MAMVGVNGSEQRHLHKKISFVFVFDFEIFLHFVQFFKKIGFSLKQFQKFFFCRCLLDFQIKAVSKTRWALTRQLNLSRELKPFD